ncbi:DUF417 family protein [Helicobacter mustelae]|uniref:Putative inner membrane protein n=1 Tax=Helicobacter mustelae (strain ATCC 43772 / CCUG 25715 / CIP 103759 / LMG 18044 / NCTC 12198 / R85-136P) TaxID=679897 RepID=D3UJ98_HELM1|nr:DUF417 family protein [Helicobacter mustelae]CBG40573.1 putative inner membrane protein [Helicobacter mustelae 12198]SQH72070.1 membrane protein [Helicobacter mustelae]
MYITALRGLSQLKHVAVVISHLAIFLIFIWIGGLKFFNYEAEGIVPFVANSPLSSFFYKDPGNYKSNKIPEGTYDEQKHQWNDKNRTYLVSYGLGILIILYGTMVLFGLIYPILGVIGGILVFLMTCITLSFLITTPEVWVANLCGMNHGFPYLSGAGRLVIKDVAIMACALVVVSSCSERILKKSNNIS